MLLPKPRRSYDVREGAKEPAPSARELSGEGHDVGKADASARQETESANSFASCTPNSQTMVRYSRTDLLQQNATRDTNESLVAPTADEQEKNASKTQDALDRLMGKRTSHERRVEVAGDHVVQKDESKSTYIKYNPGSEEGGKSDRIIRMVQAPTDPLEPPKFKHKKQPRGLKQDLVPILQAPAKKTTAEERAEWKIPPVISGWKNPGGYTISLDKRLAADGRGLVQTTVNDKFAKFSEALYVAENQARAEVESRNAEKQFLLKKKKEEQEEELRKLAAQARAEREAKLSKTRSGTPMTGNSSEKKKKKKKVSSCVRSDSSYSSSSRSSYSVPESELDVDEQAKERDKIRRERKREREKDLRLGAAGKRSKLARDMERDVSEKIALGMHVPKTATGGGIAQFDSRLFNQGASGVGSGFGPDDSFNFFSKPLFSRDKDRIYRPRSDKDTSWGSAEQQLEELKTSDRFRPSKDFAGVDRRKNSTRDGPVQFEKEK